METLSKFILNGAIASLLFLLMGIFFGVTPSLLPVILIVSVLDRVIEKDKAFAVRVFLAVCAFYAIAFSSEMIKVFIGWSLS